MANDYFLNLLSISGTPCIREISANGKYSILGIPLSVHKFKCHIYIASRFKNFNPGINMT